MHLNANPAWGGGGGEGMNCDMCSPECFCVYLISVQQFVCSQQAQRTLMCTHLKEIVNKIQYTRGHV